MVKKRYDRLQPFFEKWEKRIATPPRKAASKMMQGMIRQILALVSSSGFRSLMGYLR